MANTEVDTAAEYLRMALEKAEGGYELELAAQEAEVAVAALRRADEAATAKGV